MKVDQACRKASMLERLRKEKIKNIRTLTVSNSPLLESHFILRKWDFNIHVRFIIELMAIHCRIVTEYLVTASRLFYGTECYRGPYREFSLFLQIPALSFYFHMCVIMSLIITTCFVVCFPLSYLTSVLSHVFEQTDI